MSKENYIEEIRPHDSSYKHVSGFAEYTDDIQEPRGTLYGAIGLSKKAHAIIKKIDLSEVYKSKGIISVVTYNDIPGRNDVGPVFDGLPFLIFLALNKKFFFFKASLIVIIGFKSLYKFLDFNTAFLASSVEVAATANNG